MSKQNAQTAYMNALEEARALNAGRSGQIFLMLVALLFVLFIIWASVFQIDEITRGQGQVIPSQEMQIVQSLEGGILQEIFVKEGDRVEKGQLLLKLSDLAFSSEARGGAAKLYALKIMQARLEAEIAGSDFIVPDDLAAQNPALIDNEKSLYASRQQELQNAVSIFEDRRNKAAAAKAENEAVITKEKENLSLLQQELEAAEKMLAARAIAKTEVLRLKRTANETKGRLAEAREKIVGYDAEISALELEAKQKKDMFRTQALKELGEVKTQIIAREESLKAIGDVVDRAALRAPVDGVINAVTIKTIGGVVEPAKPLIEIVPLGDDLKINARVSPNDIAFIEEGQSVKVRISAYDSQRYGMLNGQISRIGASTMNDGEGNIYFEVEVKTEQNYLMAGARKLPITPGMLADIDVITGRKTIIAYLMKPVLRLKDQAFRER